MKLFLFLFFFLPIFLFYNNCENRVKERVKTREWKLRPWKCTWFLVSACWFMSCCCSKSAEVHCQPPSWQCLKRVIDFFFITSITVCIASFAPCSVVFAGNGVNWKCRCDIKVNVSFCVANVACEAKRWRLRRVLQMTDEIIGAYRIRNQEQHMRQETLHWCCFKC